MLKQPTWNRGFFGVRFVRDEPYISRFIPLRKVTLTDVRATNVLNLRFRLGRYVAPILDQGKRHLQVLDLTGAVPDLKETKLFIDVPTALAEMAERAPTVEEFPPQLWQSLEEELSPGAWEHVRNAFVLRLSAVRQRGKTKAMVAQEIDPSAHVYGYSLQANKAYDLEISHDRIIQKGKDTPPNEFQFVLGNPQEEIISSKRMLQLLGNYRDDYLWVKPQISTEGPIELAFESARLDQPNAFVEAKASRLIGLRIPVVFKEKSWPLMKWVNLALFIMSVVAMCLLYRYRYVGADEKTQKIMLVVFAALVSLTITSLKDFLSSKE
ncbi:MAG TPA: hypothetical protein VFP59_10770 [Candidatus Angelobacter sp.]|nr:hypothetical protein [Candidatus Angelobacter sp.]